MNPAYTLGYVQLTTVSELANSVFGNNAEATAAQAINHQFDYAKGDCVSNTAGSDFTYGPSIFLSRSDYYADALGATYAAGTVESGVLLTPQNSLDSADQGHDPSAGCADRVRGGWPVGDQ